MRANVIKRIKHREAFVLRDEIVSLIRMAVLLTTEPQDSMRQMAKAGGVTGWPTRPFDAEKLVTLVKKLGP